MCEDAAFGFCVILCVHLPFWRHTFGIIARVHAKFLCHTSAKTGSEK